MILAAAAALVACSKNELVPEVASDVETEIAYTVAPKVRSTITDFKKEWRFKSYAFYLANSQTWASHTDDPTEYIKNQEISYNTTENVWRNAVKKYYWPKAGKLTFFAYTNVTESLVDDGQGTGKGTSTYSFDASNYITPSVTATEGVKYENYDVVTNRNVDILVADIKADQTKNQDTNYGTDGNTDGRKSNFTGVPTLFRHKLSKVIFTARTNDGYDYEGKDGVTFTINSITFKGIDKVNTYTQGVDVNGMGTWGTASVSADQTYYTKGTAATGVKVTNEIVGLYADGNQYYYLPQDFKSQTGTGLTEDVFVVNYTITYPGGQVETIDQECVMNNSDDNISSVFKKWEMAKVYYINLKFSLDEIKWDPAVEEWTDDTEDVDINPTV